MKRYLKYVLIVFIVLLVLGAFAVYLLARKDVPKEIHYGMSFNMSYAKELGLDPHEVFNAIVDDLGVRRFRLSAHWDIVEPEDGIYDFKELDYELSRVDQVHGTAILAVGRRLPRWPECHVPDWAAKLSWEEQKGKILAYITTVVKRYRNNPAILYWQVENEPFLTVFAHDHCGNLDEDFLKKEIQLVHSLDPTRPVLVTDSGNLGTWAGAYKLGDVFGTSMYIYLWNPQLGEFKTVIPPWFYRAKEGLMSFLYGPKKTLLIELSAEPWLLEPVTDAPLSLQYSRMNISKFNEILQYAKDARYQDQYLWGGEWWYWLLQQGHSDMWDRGKALFQNQDQ
jgi:hypothetical protein